MAGKERCGRRKEDVEIVIVGAGIAGLSAALHLHESGFKNIIILEASNRIGGRIHTEQIGHDPSDVIDYGAHWIHGAGEGNSIYTLARKHGLISDPPVILDWYGGKFANEYGHIISQKLAKKAMNLAFDVEDTLEEEYKKKTTGLNGADSTLYGYFNSRFQILADKKFSKDQKEDAKSVFNYFLNVMRFDNAEDLRKLNSHNFGQYISVGEDEDLCINQGGFQCIISVLSRQLPPQTVMLSHPVNKIDWSKEDVQISCSTGGNFVVDHVIVTCSLGYLQKHHETLFKPELPTPKFRAINKIGFGVVNKIFLYYHQQPFWKKGEGSIRFAWTDKNRDIKSSDEWYKAIHGFDEPHNNSHVLVGSVVGIEAKHIESLPSAELKRVCTELIRRFLNDETIPEPDIAFTTKWSQNEWSCGSYCFMKDESTKSVRAELNCPLYNNDDMPVVLFAGEAHHMTRFSTADGARSSGLDQAQVLVDLYS